jgi:hypothetical protein
MKTLSLNTYWKRTSAVARGLTLATLAAGAWALSAGLTQAHASDVYWSVGIQQPGVSVGVSNAPPVVVHQYPGVRHRPVVVYQQPVVVHQPYQYVRPVVVAPQPVYYQSYGHAPRWDDRRDRHHKKWHKRHDRHDRYDRDDRYDRGDDDRRGHGRR